LIEFQGEPFPNTPEWHVVGEVSYHHALTHGMNGFAAANATYQSRTNSQFGKVQLLDVKGYTLVDLRVGIQSSDGRWALSFWGRNVTDALYTTTSNSLVDTTVRFRGMPATYGLSFSLRFG